MQDAVCTHAHKTDCAGVDVEFSSDNRIDVWYIKNVSGKLMSLCQLSRKIVNKCAWISPMEFIYFNEMAYVGFAVEFWWTFLGGWYGQDGFMSGSP